MANAHHLARARSGSDGGAALGGMPSSAKGSCALRCARVHRHVNSCRQDRDARGLRQRAPQRAALAQRPCAPIACCLEPTLHYIGRSDSSNVGHRAFQSALVSVGAALSRGCCQAGRATRGSARRSSRAAAIGAIGVSRTHAGGHGGAGSQRPARACAFGNDAGKLGWIVGFERIRRGKRCAVGFLYAVGVHVEVAVCQQQRLVGFVREQV